jgi:hypothetical protein
MTPEQRAIVEAIIDDYATPEDGEDCQLEFCHDRAEALRACLKAATEPPAVVELRPDQHSNIYHAIICWRRLGPQPPLWWS